ncbi:hypothetical protein B4U80_05083, partial [Leptotrombidium deliense]
ISKHKKTFEKGYLPNWTEEVFRVKKGTNKYGKPLYKIVDYGGEPIKGSFYPEEVQRVNVTRGDHFKIEKILKTRRRANKTEFYVKWLGYPETFNSWVDSTDIVNEAK